MPLWDPVRNASSVVDSDYAYNAGYGNWLKKWQADYTAANRDPYYTQGRGDLIAQVGRSLSGDNGQAWAEAAFGAGPGNDGTNYLYGGNDLAVRAIIGPEAFDRIDAMQPGSGGWTDPREALPALEEQRKLYQTQRQSSQNAQQAYALQMGGGMTGGLMGAAYSRPGFGTVGATDPFQTSWMPQGYGMSAQEPVNGFGASPRYGMGGQPQQQIGPSYNPNGSGWTSGGSQGPSQAPGWGGPFRPNAWGLG